MTESKARIRDKIIAQKGYKKDLKTNRESTLRAQMGIETHALWVNRTDRWQRMATFVTLTAIPFHCLEWFRLNATYNLLGQEFRP